jgi:hypothetical protein
MPRMPGPSRRDALAWAAGLAIATVVTLIASAAGARLGSALTGGVVALVATVVGALALEARSR